MKKGGTLSIRIVPENTFHIYRINANNVLKRGLDYGDRIKKLFLIPSDVEGDEREIGYIRFTSKNTAYGYPRKTTLVKDEFSKRASLSQCFSASNQDKILWSPFYDLTLSNSNRSLELFRGAER
jgi:hypothetical protein